MRSRSRRVFRRVFIWTAMLLAIVTLYGCAQGGKTDAGDVAAHDAVEEAEPVLTVMSLDAEEASYQNYIHEAEEELGITIELQVPDHDANNRMALFSTQLSTGDDSVDVYTLNDEMLCEFKRKGYLAPLPEDLMEEKVLSSYPQEYLREICMYEDSLYAVPFYMDIYMLWVNQEDLECAGLKQIRTLEDFNVFLENASTDGTYGYGGAWEKTYSYNDIFEFINLFGGNCRDWNDENTRRALVYLHDMVEQQHASKEQLIDRYDQTIQKIMDGKISSAFLYSGSIYQASKLDAYSAQKVHVQMLPDFGSNRTNVAAWSYAVNNASENKELAYRFLSYAASDEGTVNYSNAMHRLPARLDILQQDLDVPDIEIMQQYAEECALTLRTFTAVPMEGIETIGDQFASYVLNEITLDDLCQNANAILAQE